MDIQPRTKTLGVMEILGKTDIYQAGAILYLLLTGSHPYGQGNLYEPVNNMMESVQASLIVPSQIRQDLGCFDRMIARSL